MIFIMLMLLANVLCNAQGKVYITNVDIIRNIYLCIEILKYLGLIDSDIASLEGSCHMAHTNSAILSCMLKQQKPLEGC